MLNFDYHSVNTIAMGAERLEILPIRSLRVPGYESADKTAAVRYRACAV